MNGVHDMGGRMGFGQVVAEKDEPVFHAPWEGRFFGLANAVGEFGRWTLDEDRHACENCPPQDYLRRSYYENWLEALERLLVAKNVASAGEIRTGHSSSSVKETPKLRAPDVIATLMARGSYQRDGKTRARFSPGDKVRVHNLHVSGHTRLPGYLRGASGEIITVHGCHVWPDANAHDRGEDPQWLYGVRFRAQDVWGGSGRDTLCADLWEPYLEPA